MTSVGSWFKWLFAPVEPSSHVARIEAVATRIENASKRIEKSADALDEFGQLQKGMRGTSPKTPVKKKRAKR